MRTLIAWLRWWIGRLTTRADRVGRSAKIVRALLLVPAFGAVLVALHLRRRRHGALTVEGCTEDGSRLRCHLPDLIPMYIALFDVWEPDLTQLIAERLQPGDVLVDVGANIGYYTLLAARRVGDGGAVVAIEAAPAIHAELRRNVEANGVRNVRTVQAAAGDREGELSLYSGPSHNLGLTTTVPGRGLRHETTVRAAPLAALLSPEELQRARIVKIDVEGGEPAVIAGMAAMLRNGRDDLELLLELSPRWWRDPALTPESVLAPLRAAGFNTYVMDNSYWPWRYLWPRAVRRPQRIDRLADRRVKRIDLVLSRVDAPYL